VQASAWLVQEPGETMQDTNDAEACKHTAMPPQECQQHKLDMPTSHRDSAARSSNFSRFSTIRPPDSFYDCDSEVKHHADERASQADAGSLTWVQAALLIMGETLGTGILGLPGAAATLGWMMSAIILVLFGYFASFSGNMLARLKTQFYPESTGFADLAMVTVGPRFRTFTRFMIITNWLLLMPYYIISAGSSLKYVAPHSSLCGWQWSLIAAACYLLPSQFTTLKYVSYMSAPSLVAILVATIILIAYMFIDGAHDASGASVGFGEATHVLPRMPSDDSQVISFFTFYTSISSFVFSYQGQDMFVELMDDMADKKQAAKAVSSAYTFMSLAYGITVLAAYGNQGENTPGFLPDGLKDGPAKAVTGVLIAFHVLVAYVFTSNLVGKFFFSKVFPQSSIANASKGSLIESLPTRMRWLAVQSTLVLFSYVIANLIPNFESMQGLLGSLCAAPIVFGFPSLFFLRAHKCKDVTLSWSDAILSRLFLYVLCPLFMILGTIGAAISMVQSWSNGSTKPFSCVA